MCGFITAINFKEEKKLKIIFNNLKKINKHRGPDNIRLLQEENFSILFRRLSILDISNNSNQPFVSEDGYKILIFNGEIYNYLELKKLLKKKYSFKTTSDTEVIMRCYEEWGIKFVKKLRGMFSIVLFDKLKKETFLLRDRLGQKPLYYTFIKKSLVISSEIKDILFFLKQFKIPILENKKIVNKYLIRGWADDTNECFFENIFQLPPGTFSIFKNKKLSKPISYWKLNLNKKNTFNQNIFKKKFEENLKIHLRSDVPIACTLSGGMDSGSIVKTSLKLKKKITAFSLINSYSDESEVINKLVKQPNLKHYYINTNRLHKKDTLTNVIKFQDEPLLTPSHFDQFLLRKKIKSKGFKVLLVGEGGDEVLGGYLRLIIAFICEKKLDKYSNNQFIFKKLLKFFNTNKHELEEKINNFKEKKNKKSDIEDKSPLYFLKHSKNFSKKLKYKSPYFFNEKNLFKKSLKQQMLKRDLPHILRAEDRISMAHSIETRSPFVDHTFIEYVLDHKTNDFLRNGIPKFMLRKTMKDVLPDEYINFKKVGRPGNSDKILKFYSTQFIKLIKKHKLTIFNRTKILNEFKISLKKSNFGNTSFFYFRILNYLIWKDLNFPR